MKRVTQVIFMLALVLVLALSMASTAFAKPKDGGVAVAAVDTLYVYADNPGWQKTGSWTVEDYTSSGGTKLLVANDAGATAKYTFGGSDKTKTVEVYASTYWTSGYVEILLDGTLVATVNLNSDTTTYGTLIYKGKFGGNPWSSHTVEIRATGTGGPGTVYFDGIPYDLSYLHFVNVQYLKAY
jgi:hypothetical protein